MLLRVSSGAYHQPLTPAPRSTGALSRVDLGQSRCAPAARLAVATVALVSRCTSLLPRRVAAMPRSTGHEPCGAVRWPDCGDRANLANRPLRPTLHFAAVRPGRLPRPPAPIARYLIQRKDWRHPEPAVGLARSTAAALARKWRRRRAIAPEPAESRPEKKHRSAQKQRCPHAAG